MQEIFTDISMVSEMSHFIIDYIYAVPLLVVYESKDEFGCVSSDFANMCDIFSATEFMFDVTLKQPYMGNIRHPKSIKRKDI